MTDVAYFANWFPYSVYAGRIEALALDRVVLADIWRPRIVTAAVALIAFIVMRRVYPSWFSR
jgi:hypothetical protein